MNKEVSFPIAQLLKEKGFKQPSFYYYDGKGKLHEPYLENGSSTDVDFRVDLTDLLEYHNSYQTKHISAPTIAEVVMWLYEKYGIWITVDADIQGFYGHYKINPIGTLSSNLKQGWTNSQTNPFDSPTEAYEAAIEYTLNNLI